MSNYKFINPGLWKGVSADDAVTELERIRAKYGTLKPEYIVEESKGEEALLHKCFQWDNEKAAALWRKEQAATLLRNIVVVTIVEEVEIGNIRAYVNVVQEALPDRTYVPIAQAIVDDKAYADLLAQAKGEMESFVRKYSQITELNRAKAEMLAILADNE